MYSIIRMPVASSVPK